jgi:hypothetical protein
MDGRRGGGRRSVAARGATTHGCNNCWSGTDSSLSVDGQCNSNGFSSQQCAGQRPALISETNFIQT